MKERLEHPKININIVELFINSGAQLNRIISAGYSFNCSILTLAISFHLFDIAKLVIKNRLDPIWVEMVKFVLFFSSIMFLGLTIFSNG